MHALGEKYLRKTSLPTLFCPGCGDGTILNAMLQIVDKLGKENFLFVSGIGCSSWIPVFINADVIHSLHGRPIAVATGLKLTQPDKHVVVFTGDGDCVGIGGNHFIHAARRNINLTVIMVNNYIYGMTGGQTAPTTPLEVVTKTAPYGNCEPSFDTPELAKAAGATFVARANTVNVKQLRNNIEKGILHDGFSFIEVMTQCPTQAGRNIFGSGDPAFLFNEIKKRSVSNLAKELEENQFHIGVLHHDLQRPSYNATTVRKDER